VPVRGLAGFGAVASSSVGGVGEDAAGGAGCEAAGLEGAVRGVAPSSDSLLDDVGGEVADGVAADLDWGERGAEPPSLAGGPARRG
jgi:hypothetical protein